MNDFPFEFHTDDIIEKMYATGHTFFYQKDYFSAVNTFKYLTNLFPEVKKYWLSLATAQLHSQDFKDAVESYYKLNVLDPKDPHSFFFASHCFLKMNNYAKALHCLEKAIDIAHDHPAYQELRIKAKMLLEDLKSHDDLVEDNVE